MAFLIKENGQVSPIKPRNGKHFSFEELYEVIGCELVQLVKLDGGYYMIVDESGALKKHRVQNMVATEMYQSCLPSKEKIDERMEEYKKMGFNIITIPGNEENLVFGNVVVCKRNQID